MRQGRQPTRGQYSRAVPDASAPEPAVPPRSTSALPVGVAESASEPVVERAPHGEPVAAEKRKRGVGVWSFVLGLLSTFGDLGFVVVIVVVLVGAVSALTTGDLGGVATVLGAGGLALSALVVFFGGFLTGGLAALLGLIALVGGRGRVLGLFGLLFGAAAIAVRVALLSAGFSPDLG